jgi:hypothetical protein
MFLAIRHDPEPPERVMVGRNRAAEKIGYFQDFLTTFTGCGVRRRTLIVIPFSFSRLYEKIIPMGKALEYITNTGGKLSPVVTNLTSYCHRLF